MAVTQKETTHIVAPFICHMEALGWHCRNIVGSMMQSGLPDYYCYHPTYGYRWIEFKRHKQENMKDTPSVTPAQKVEFPKMYACGLKIYVVKDYDLRGVENKHRREYHYRRLFEKPNIMEIL